MKLPRMKYSDGITKKTQVKFGGYNHSLYASEGDIYDMKNVSSEYYPLISQRKERAAGDKISEFYLWKGETYCKWEFDSLYIADNGNIADYIATESTIVITSKDNKELEGTYIISGGDLEEYNSQAVSQISLSKNLENKSNGYQWIDITIKVINSTMNNSKIMSIGSGDAQYFVADDGFFYYDNMVYGWRLSKDKKFFAETNSYIYILPDHAYFNKITKTLTTPQSVTYTWRSSYDFDWDGVCIYNTKKVPFFKAGDKVIVKVEYQRESSSPAEYFISQATVKRIQIGDDFIAFDFTEEIFEKVRMSTGDEQHTAKVKEITVSEGDIPALNNVCAVNNRIWGCDEDTIYCTAFGKPDEWFDYSASSDGNVADISYAVTPFDGAGKFTGCCVYDGIPMFFKENYVYKVYGSNASNFQLSGDETPGVLKGAEKSIAVVDDRLFFLSPVGVMMYYGGSKRNITTEFYEHFSAGCAGGYNGKYYISMKGKNGWRLYVYDTKKGIWTVEDDVEIVNFATYKNKLYSLTSENKVICHTPDDDMISPWGNAEMTMEGNFDSFIEFGDYYASSPNKKGVSKLFFRISIEKGASVSMLINYDSETDENGQRVWKKIKTVEACEKRSFTLPVIPKRCDHFRIRLEGEGSYVLYSLSYEYYNGSDL